MYQDVIELRCLTEIRNYATTFNSYKKYGMTGISTIHLKHHASVIVVHTLSNHVDCSVISK